VRGSLPPPLDDTPEAWARRVVEWLRQVAAQGVDGAVVDVELELDGGVWLLRL